MKEYKRFKCLIVGDAAVGKTAITQMFLSDGNKFPKSYNLTFGVEISLKYLDTEEPCEIIIYDSSGHDIYTELLVKIWKDIDILVVVFDVTSEQTLENSANWAHMVKQTLHTDVPAILFGNKTDLTLRRVVTMDQAEAVAGRLNMLTYMEGSAKEFDCIREIFSTLVKSVSS